MNTSPILQEPTPTQGDTKPFVTFVAFQVPPAGEPLYHSLYAMMEVCSLNKVFFRTIETLGYHPAKNGTRVLRVKLDLDPVKLPNLEAALATINRGLIYFRGEKEGYHSSKLGGMSISAMLTSANPATHVTLRGTKIKEWRRQFPSDLYAANKGTP